MTGAEFESRRAVEAIRAGVPNRDAVRALGSCQPHLEERFEEGLRACGDAAEEGKQARGLLIAGDFGSGKSHLLEHLHHLALERNFISSKIVVSKETPLYDPAKLYRAAIDAAVAPGRQGNAIREIAQTLQAAPGYSAFSQRIMSDSSGLDARFSATALIFDRVGTRDLELRDRVLSFWSGRRINLNEVKRALRQLGERTAYRLGRIPERELALQRFRFAGQLFTAAGYAGWVLLVDEVELISRYSLLQRARSYAETARWMGALGDEQSCPSLFSVLAVTPDLQTEVIEGRDDRERVRARLTARGQPEDLLLASNAEKGMRELARPVRLRAPAREQIEAVGARLREIHATAYGWDPPSDLVFDRQESVPLRLHIRSWINKWDLQRLYPAYRPELEATVVEQEYTEDRDLEVAAEPEADGNGSS